MRIGLTGGIASGKSTVAAAFAALGVPVIDSDEIAREVVAPGSTVLTRITHEFGDRILDENGALDRNRMRELVFSDPAKRRALEAIVHPEIRARLNTAAAAAVGPYQLLVVPLLVENGMQREFDRVLVVDCPESLQLSRLIERDGEDEAGARRILAAQSDRAGRIACADDIIVNDGDVAALERAVDDLHRIYCALAN